MAHRFRRSQLASMLTVYMRQVVHSSVRSMRAQTCACARAGRDMRTYRSESLAPAAFSFPHPMPRCTSHCEYGSRCAGRISRSVQQLEPHTRSRITDRDKERRSEARMMECRAGQPVAVSDTERRWFELVGVACRTGQCEVGECKLRGTRHHGTWELGPASTWAPDR